ncbi:helix-turn-helix transcriptional regulator [Lentzea sp. NPDC005914]|uniref:helix-turn-helix domain-containing protein n=1 Tax=Lentzea sp. NPDC005914 TaxID=3154572 RepID=UPI0033ECE63A
MASDVHHNELGEFLKARRAKLSPRTVGLPDGGTQRRVTGLRREEVALLAAISTDHYTRVEQGRIRPSASVLAALARILHLDDDQRAQMFELAGKQAAQPRSRAAQQVQPQLRRLLDDLTAIPGMVLGRSMDILEWNPLAAALLTDFAKIPEKKRNYAHLLFTDPAMKTLYLDWAIAARACVAHLWTRAVKYPDDPRLAVLVGDLSMRSPEFRQWWGAPHTASRTTGTKALNHPAAGTLSLDWGVLTCGADTGQELVIWTAERGTRSHDGLQILSSWTASSAGGATS